MCASLTVTEHLTLLKPASAKDGWNLTRVFDTFPRLAERRHHRGSQLSGESVRCSPWGAPFCSTRSSS